MTYRLRNILIALALAIVAALLTTFYVANYKRHVQHQQATVPVVVAAKDIPVGLTGQEILKGHYLTTQSVVHTSVVPGALSDPNQIANQVATQPIYAGEQVTVRRFGAQTELGVSGQIKDVYRALQLPGDGNQLLNGTLVQGDHVDVLANVKIHTAAGDQAATRVVLRDIKVLRVSGSASGKVALGTTGPGTWVMLAVTDQQAQKMYWLQANASWWLALRPLIHDADSPNSIDDAETVITDGLKLNDLAQIYAGKVPTR